MRVSAGLSADRPASPWRLRGLLVALCIAVLLLCYRGTVLDLVRVWSNSSTFNHCFLIPLLSLYLVREKRRQLAGLPAATSVLGLLWMLPNALLWLFGAFLDVSVFQHLALVGLIIGATWALIGNTAFRLLLFPLFYLYFAVPEGEFLVTKLQDVTAMFIVMLLRMTFIPVYMQGLYITIPSGNFVVAKACSGINYLIATLALGTLFAYLSYRSWWRRAAFMSLVLVVPIIANGIRAYGIIMIAHLSDYRLAMGVDHFIYGWVFFGIVIFALFFIGNLFAENDKEGPEVTPPAGERSAGPAHSGAVAAAAVAIALLGPGLDTVTSARLGTVTNPGLPAALEPTGERGAELLGARYVGATDLRSAATGEGEDAVHILQASYERQRSGAELIQSTNRPYDEEVWRSQDRATRDTGAGFRVREVLLRGPMDDLLLWSWYDIHGQPTISNLEAKLIQAKARLFGADTGVAAYQAWTPVTDVEAPDAARARLAAFIARYRPGLAGP